MKKYSLSVICVVLFALLAGCGNKETSNITVDYGDSANDNDLAFTQCIMFDSSFRSPKEGGGAWEPDTEYTWSWWLARSDGGEWKLMTWGY